MSLLNDDVVLLSIYPKRGPQGAVDLSDSEYGRLVAEMIQESLTNSLHLVDIKNYLAELSQNGCLMRNRL